MEKKKNAHEFPRISTSFCYNLLPNYYKVCYNLGVNYDMECNKMKVKCPRNGDYTDYTDLCRL